MCAEAIIYLLLYNVHDCTFKETKPSNDSAICNNILNYYNILSFDEFTINDKLVLETKESLLIKRDIAVLNKSITSAKLFLFNSFFLTAI